MTPLLWMNRSASLSRQPFSHDKLKLNVSRSFTQCLIELALRSQPCMTSVFSWRSLWAAAGSVCRSWCQPRCASGLSVWSLRNMPGWIGESIFFPLRLCVTLIVHAVRHCRQDVIPPAVSLPKLPPPSVAGSDFQACQQATALCQMRMTMWHSCQWRWSQVRLLSP